MHENVQFAYTILSSGSMQSSPTRSVSHCGGIPQGGVTFGDGPLHQPMTNSAELAIAAQAADPRSR
jgi:hypothetical protein